MANKKLKRFLLKYDPPGIGLEVEDSEGEVSVVHKTLFPLEEVRSEMDILALVEELCASEPDLLHPRKHRGSLLQLLGKLYQVEAFGGGRAESSTKAASSPSPAPKETSKEESAPDPREAVTPAGAESRIQEGSRVVLVGMAGKFTHFNGQEATVKKMKPEKGKYEVSVGASSSEHGEILKLKNCEHMLSVNNASQPFAIGTCVVICQLRNHVELNGCIGRVVDIHDQGQRYEVRTANSGQLFRVRGDNVVSVEASEVVNLFGKENHEPNTASHGSTSSMNRTKREENDRAVGDAKIELFDPGSIVEIVGLKDNKSFNGLQAKILTVDRESLRYEVRMLQDESVKKLRAENARLIAIQPAAPHPHSHSPGCREGHPESWHSQAMIGRSGFRR
jgi:hypothetical protein